VSDRAEADRALLVAAVALKHLDRSGWLRIGVDRPESVAAHSFGVALAALVHARPEHDLGKLLAMAILHDLPEIVVGDLTPFDGVSRDEKRARENVALDVLLSSHPDLRALATELERNESAEARLIHDLDKLDMDVTAEVYAARGHDVAEFHASAAPAVARLRASPDASPRSEG